MVEDRRATKTNDRKIKRKVHDNKQDGSNKKSKLAYWKCGKSGHFKRDCRVGKGGNYFKNTNGASGSGEGSKDHNLNEGNKKYFVTFIDDATRVVVRLPTPKKKSLGEIGIDCIFIGYAEHSKAYRFYVIEPNDFISINTVIESRDAIFDETRFSSIPTPKEMIPSTSGTHKETESFEMTPDEPVELKKSKRKRKPKSLGPDFQLYLIEGSKDKISTRYPYCFNVEDDLKTFDEAMKSQDVAFWKKAINDEIDSIMGNNT
ncbi:hypothetical protein Sango_2299400 [Sesamum angolense]|uniref:CCHC-type domain-containing protein n=1 Tax=Sesamum angolense TaxID=2727404 RepID=A0AAE1WAE9_9LAMI|nr:hypothetical protein Sango_2299400 [Sesamum angolense]